MNLKLVLASLVVMALVAIGAAYWLRNNVDGLIKRPDFEYHGISGIGCISKALLYYIIITLQRLKVTS